jgi:hypothetical protein
MTLYDLVHYAIDNYYECYVYDCDKEENVFEGEISDIPEELLECNLGSWELNFNGTIGFNIYE